MRTLIDLFYADGEVKNFVNVSLPEQKYLFFSCAEVYMLDFRFCDCSGKRLELIPLNKFGRAQILLSSRDRLLVSSEENITYLEDRDGYQILRLEKLNFDTPEIRRLLSESYWSLEPRDHGRIKCEFSAALYVNENFRTAIQLFFTLDAVLKQ